jgi:hypothetical protein
VTLRTETLTYLLRKKGQLWNIGDIRSNNVPIECSVSFLHEKHDGQTSEASGGQKQYWSDLHSAWTQASPDACCGDVDATIPNFQTIPKDVVVLCPKAIKGMKRIQTKMRHWKDDLTRGVDYTLNLYARSLSSILFQELSRTTRGGKGMNSAFSSLPTE